MQRLLHPAAWADKVKNRITRSVTHRLHHSVADEAYDLKGSGFSTAVGIPSVESLCTVPSTIHVRDEVVEYVRQRLACRI